MFAVVLLLALSLAQAVQARTIKVATMDYLPSTSPDIDQGGFQIALIRAAFNAAGHDVEVVFSSWKRAMKNVIEGRSDVITSIFYSQERNQQLLFSVPLYHSEMGLVGLKDLGFSEFVELQDLKGYRIGVLSGSLFSPEFDAAHYLNKVQLHSDDLNVAMLYKKRVDLVATSLSHFRYLVMESPAYDESELLFLRPRLMERSVHIAASRAVPDHQQVIDDFHAGLEMISRSGRYDEILREFGMSHLIHE